MRFVNIWWNRMFVVRDFHSEMRQPNVFWHRQTFNRLKCSQNALSELNILGDLWQRFHSNNWIAFRMHIGITIALDPSPAT